MNKDQLQQEILKRVKPGMKPSDLKKPKLNTPASSPPPSPLITSLDKQTKQKPKPKNILPPPIVQESKKIKQLQEQVNFHANLANNYLTSLQATMAKLDQAELTIKDLQAKIKADEQKYSELEKASKSPAKIKPTEIKTQNKSTQTPPEPKEPKLYLFTCDICEQNKKSQLHLGKVNGLGIDPNKQNKICAACFKKVDIIKEREEDFF